MPRGCCLAGPLSLPYAGIRWCLDRGWQGYIILGVAGLLLMIFIVSFYSCVCDSLSGSGKKDPTLPSKIEAPYVVDTWSRQYVAEKAEQDPETGDVTMWSYWERVGDEWVRYELELVLEESAFGEMVVRER